MGLQIRTDFLSISIIHRVTYRHHTFTELLTDTIHSQSYLPTPYIHRVTYRHHTFTEFAGWLLYTVALLIGPDCDIQLCSKRFGLEGDKPGIT